MNYISTHLYRKMIRQAMAEGLTVQDLAGIPTSLAEANEVEAVPADHFFELHEMLDQKLGSAFSLRVGQAMEIEDYGVLGLSWRTCARAGEIFERSERYFKLLSDTYAFKVVADGDLTHVYLNRHAYRRGVALSNQATFSATVVVLRAMTEKELSPVKVCFKHAASKTAQGFEATFGCPVAFGQKHNIITYRTTDFNTRTAKADAAINRFLVERVEEQVRGIEISPNRLVADVESLIRDALPSGIPSVDSIAQMLGMSNRTLARRLRDQNLTFRDIITKVQQTIARDLLEHSSRSVGEIAYETGFSEQSAFNRAFKRWTGQSPLAFRSDS